MKNHPEIFHLDWQGIAIEISFTADWSNAFREVYGYSLTHTEIRAENKQRLPITETGYKSAFLPTSTIEEQGGPLGYVEAWLNAEADSQEWTNYCEEQRQGSLF